MGNKMVGRSGPGSRRDRGCAQALQAGEVLFGLFDESRSDGERHVRTEPLAESVGMSDPISESTWPRSRSWSVGPEVAEGRMSRRDGADFRSARR